MLWNLLIFGLIANVFAASSKRDDYSSSSSSGNSQSVSFPSSSYSSSNSGSSGYTSGSSSYGSAGSPTYTSGSSGYSSGSSAYGTGSSSYGTGNKAYSSGGSPGYASSSTSTGSVSSQPASQGNLYYYYYPVQQKPQDGSSYVAQGSSSAGSYSSSTGEDNYDSGSSAAVAYGNQVAAAGNGDYEAQESNYNGAVSPLDANYGTASLGSLGGFNAGSFGSNGLVGGGGYNSAASAQVGYVASAPGVGYGSGSYGNNLVGYPASYGAGYGYPQSPEFNGGKRFGLSSLIMPMLALAGLGLLIPTVTSLGSRTKKTKRSLNDPTSFSSIGERLDRYLAIYRSATESEECISRIICELGNTMTDVTGKSTILTILEKVVPSWMKQKMGVFKNAVLSRDAGKCRKYKC
ncbi:probable peroxisomal membrane protein PEX13 [Centruroides sculpturatus]|uniref:probable peroxisomal membrane protein PEX13 n=1 Tax=Centruroides sculpturatus TaxID=218467 RepID=UPI000C6E02C4|nr:probable peroxisomal membrane protein PEX13 [Centruroides sculpturatus]